MDPSEILPNEASLAFVEALYEDFQKDPSSVGDDWRACFERLPDGDRARRRRPVLPAPSIFNPPAPPSTGPGAAGSEADRQGLQRMATLQDRVDQLVRSYRVRGHVIARLDPIGPEKPLHPELDYRYYGLTDEDLDRSFSCLTMGDGGPTPFLPLRDILAHLRSTYCSYIGVQYMHIDDVEIKRWLQLHMESLSQRPELGRDEQIRILTRLADAEMFETFIQKKFIGAKRFSLEGAETLIPLLDLAIEEAGRYGVEQVVIGMAHRGRLNVLANIMQKSAALIFREFEDTDPELHFGRGDVKYHLGYSSEWRTAGGGRIDLNLCFNPSHLEFVNPVAVGRVRARQDRRGPEARGKVMSLVIHGDAAFAGEGIVQETLNMSELPGYTVGGTVHIVVNNQIGFTTSPRDARSTQYPTDVARMLQVPIFHVNGEDPESVARVIKLAMAFRETFQREVVIDMYCYRKHGHNEGDEPSFTHPRLYGAIRERHSVRQAYTENLLRLDKITAQEAEQIAVERRHHLEEELSRSREPHYEYSIQMARGIWTGYRGGLDSQVPEVATAVPRERLSALLESLARLPDDFHLHPKLAKLLETRREMAAGRRPLDWAAGEALAFASVASDGSRVRVSGQDSRRGTFSHRHAVLYDYEDGHPLFPFSRLGDRQAPCDFIDSPLSEAGVLGFEYGYSLDAPDALVIWEAQFGDFVNAAQVIVDQFIASSEAKWHRLTGLVLFLPHSFEGQGPKHSSARLERFLFLAAEDNIQVVNLTTPAQLFHCLRRQVLRPLRKPLVVMSPKSLLRHPAVVSPLEDLAEGRFQRVIPDTTIEDPTRVKRILLCSGKLYYELQEARDREPFGESVAIVRLEQLYPIHDDTFERAIDAYPENAPVVWVQEEPADMGALTFLKTRFGHRLLGTHPFFTVSRPESATPATGSASSHRIEQEWLIAQAFNLA